MIISFQVRVSNLTCWSAIFVKGSNFYNGVSTYTVCSFCSALRAPKIMKIIRFLSMANDLASQHIKNDLQTIFGMTFISIRLPNSHPNCPKTAKLNDERPQNAENLMGRRLGDAFSILVFHSNWTHDTIKRARGTTNKLAS